MAICLVLCKMECWRRNKLKKNLSNKRVRKNSSNDGVLYASRVLMVDIRNK